jgi:hypothetical protein
MAAHKNKAAWFVEFASMTKQIFATRELAAAAEHRAIKTEKPKYNIVYNDDGEQAELFESEACGEKQLERISVNRADAAEASKAADRKRCIHCDTFRDYCSLQCFGEKGPANWISECESVPGGWTGVDCYGYRLNLTGDLPSRPIILMALSRGLLHPVPIFMKRKAA